MVLDQLRDGIRESPPAMASRGRPTVLPDLVHVSVGTTRFPNTVLHLRLTGPAGGSSLLELLPFSVFIAVSTFMKLFPTSSCL